MQPDWKEGAFCQKGNFQVFEDKQLLVKSSLLNIFLYFAHNLFQLILNSYIFFGLLNDLCAVISYSKCKGAGMQRLPFSQILDDSSQCKLATIFHTFSLRQSRKKGSVLLYTMATCFISERLYVQGQKMQKFMALLVLFLKAKNKT